MARRIGKRIGAYSKSKAIPFRSSVAAHEKPLLQVVKGDVVLIRVYSTKADKYAKEWKRELVYRAVFVAGGRYNPHLRWLPVEKMLGERVYGKVSHIIRDGEYYEVTESMRFKVLTKEEAVLEAL